MEYRIAGPKDAAAIAGLIEATWGAPAYASWIADVVALPRHAVWLAIDGARVRGFCAGFDTLAADGSARWEVDLLAVDEKARGQGLGRALVSRCAESGRGRGIRFQRALIAADNAPSQRVFAACGFSLGAVADLWVGTAAAEMTGAPPPKGAHIVPVETLTYSGFWIEERFDTEAIAAARQLALERRRNTVGMVVPSGAAHDAETHALAHIGSYQWWVCKL